jgi:hypothetical protein
VPTRLGQGNPAAVPERVSYLFQVDRADDDPLPRVVDDVRVNVIALTHDDEFSLVLKGSRRERPFPHLSRRFSTIFRTSPGFNPWFTR